MKRTQRHIHPFELLEQDEIKRFIINLQNGLFIIAIIAHNWFNQIQCCIEFTLNGPNCDHYILIAQSGPDWFIFERLNSSSSSSERTRADRQSHLGSCASIIGFVSFSFHYFWDFRHCDRILGGDEPFIKKMESNRLCVSQRCRDVFFSLSLSAPRRNIEMKKKNGQNGFN